LREETLKRKGVIASFPTHSLTLDIFQMAEVALLG